jgi:hypothetical protein
MKSSYQNTLACTDIETVEEFEQYCAKLDAVGTCSLREFARILENQETLQKII